jgi:hypothetical protein
MESYALCKQDTIMDQYGWKSELPYNFSWESPTSNLNNIYKMVYGMHRKVHLWLYVNRLNYAWKLEPLSNF